MSDRWFTPDSARQVLDELRPVAERMCELYRDLEDRRPRQILPEQPVERVYFSLVQRLQQLLSRIHRSGARVKDLRRGLLDFPARRDGREVLLCWKVGERSLEFWHEMDDGYSGRQRVDDDGPWDDG
jgi:hypothetical protein